MAEADLSADIQEAAEGVAEARSDGQFAKAVPISDLIEADRYLAAKAATQTTGKKTAGVLFRTIKPSGST